MLLLLLALYWALRGWMPARWALGTCWSAALWDCQLLGKRHHGDLSRGWGRWCWALCSSERRLAPPGRSSGAGACDLGRYQTVRRRRHALPFLMMLAWQNRIRVAGLVKIAVPALALTAAALAGLGVYLNTSPAALSSLPTDRPKDLWLAHVVRVDSAAAH
jgi:hypothetical protein